jgi:hypothetical protein
MNVKDMQMDAFCCAGVVGINSYKKTKKAPFNLLNRHECHKLVCSGFQFYSQTVLLATTSISIDVFICVKLYLHANIAIDKHITQTHTSV